MYNTLNANIKSQASTFCILIKLLLWGSWSFKRDSPASVTSHLTQPLFYTSFSHWLQLHPVTTQFFQQLHLPRMYIVALSSLFHSI